MKICYKSARHGLAYKVVVEESGPGERPHYGIVGRAANGDWWHQWNEAQPTIEGFKTRMDATVGLLLSWGGRGGAPTGAEIYRWALGK